MPYLAMLFLTFASGAFAAYAWAACTQAVQKKDPLKAAAWNGAVAAAYSLVALSIWSATGNNPVVLMFWTLGNAAGAYGCVAWTR